MRRIVLLAACWVVPAVAAAQYGGAKKAAAPAAADETDLPPFLRGMTRHAFDVKVLRRGADAKVAPVGAGQKVAIAITANGNKLRDYFAVTGADGVAHMEGIPANPAVKASIGYQINVDADGVRFRFALNSVPTGGKGHVEVTINSVATDLSAVRLEHSIIELIPDEEALFVSHRMRLLNAGTTAVNLAAQPGGGLPLPLPAGAQHPSVRDQDELQPKLEVRGDKLFHTGTLLPGVADEISIVYSFDYDQKTLHWSQSSPVPVTAALVVASLDKREGQSEAVPLEVQPPGDGQGWQVRESRPDNSRRFTVMQAQGLNLPAGAPLEFTVSGLPAPSKLGDRLVYASVLLILFVVFFGFRRPPSMGDVERLSRTHLETERDRLVRALARMNKAVERGRMTRPRFEREREAITARLVALYRALDRLGAA